MAMHLLDRMLFFGGARTLCGHTLRGDEGGDYDEPVNCDPCLRAYRESNGRNYFDDYPWPGW